jgi:hypothetical protein
MEAAGAIAMTGVEAVVALYGVVPAAMVAAAGAMAIVGDGAAREGQVA